MDVTALFNLSYGLYVVSSDKNNQFNGQIANTVFQITADPMTLAVSINKDNVTHECIESSKHFSVSILEQDTPMQFIGHFGFKSGKDINKAEGMDIIKGTEGCSIVKNHTVAYIECELIKSVDVFTHTIFIGKIVNAVNVKKAPPMTYAYYHQIKGGKTPPKAATFVKNQTNNKESTMADEKWICDVCGWEYDPATGDPDNGVPAGTKFEDIPDDWVCPVCGASKDEFSKA